MHMNKPAPKQRSFRSRLLHKEHLTPAIILAHVNAPEDFIFQAGQYVNLGVAREGGEVQKPVSIASAPSQNGHLEFIIKLTLGKVLGAFFSEASPGAEMSVTGPMGGFVVEERGPIHFIAAGVGVAPVRSMYQDLLLRRYKYPVRLSLLREPEEWGVFDVELAESYRACKNFSYSLIHASPELAGPEWGWRHLNIGFPEQDETGYLSGSREFVSKIKETLLARGFEADRLITR